ncbi:MAG: type IX secretion system plug protein domain-containing protein [Bacteroidota bacterium]
MYSKAPIYLNIALIILFALSTASCIPSDSRKSQQSSESSRNLEQTLTLPQQKAPPEDIQNIQLHPEGQPGQTPVIDLNSSEKLVLSFDYLNKQNRQFRVTVKHYSQNWTESGIGPNTYLDSFSETTIQSSEVSFSQRPTYRHTKFSFPNDELRPAVSGNYMIEIYDSGNGDLLFSMPFFITEEEGQIETKVERLFTQRSDGRPLDQLFSTYHYPDFVEYPQFDLSMSFAQNQFWGRMKTVKSLDTITDGELHGYLERDEAFVGNYEFKHLNLRNFTADGRQILEYQSNDSLPRIILRRDVQNLDTDANLPKTAANRGLPDDDRNSNYAQVEFQLETDARVSPSSEIYIVGNFNNWMINERNRLHYSSSNRIWKGHALIKQGAYAYKYVNIEDNRINDLSLDQGFLSTQQEYLTFIYFEDPNNNYDRLLKVDKKTQQ